MALSLHIYKILNFSVEFNHKEAAQVEHGNVQEPQKYYHAGKGQRCGTAL